MNAKFGSPCAVFVSKGDVFVGDTEENFVKVIRNGQVATIAGTGADGYNGDGQPALKAQLNGPDNLFVSSQDEIYIAEKYGNRIRKILKDGTITTIVGDGNFGFAGDDGLAVNAQLSYPLGLFVTEEQEVLFADYENNRIRKVDQCGIITTIAGTGNLGFNGDGIPATSADLKLPNGVFVYRKEIYICDCFNHRIRKILENGNIITIAGTGEEGYNGDGLPATSAQLNFPESVFVYNDEIFITDRGNHRIRKILKDGNIVTIAGTGEEGFNGDGMLATEVQLNFPTQVAVEDSIVYIADDGNKRILKVDADGMIFTFAGTLEKLE